MASGVALVIASGPASVLAEGGRLNVKADLEYQYSDISQKDKETGEKTDSVFSRFKQKYDVELQKELFPFLEFRTGGYYELIDSSATVDGPDSDTAERTGWLFAELNLNNPLYTAGTAYRRREFTFDPGDFEKTKISREEFTGLFRWRPVGFPIFDLDVDSTRVWDRDDTVDLGVDRVIFKSRYDYRDLSYNYTYTRNDTEEKIDDSGSLTQIHNAGVQYSHGFFNDRLHFTGAARLNYQLQKPYGDGEIERPTSPPGTPFFFTDDSDQDTLTAVDAANPLTLINIGRNAPIIPVSVGLDFGFPTEVNRIHVLPLIDPENPLLATSGEIDSVADGFEWTVFVSDDQENWTELDVVEASYSFIDSRFEITFERVDDARFIKVVTDPQPDAPGEIRTAEIRAFTTLEVSPGTEVEDFDQTVNFGLRWAISDSTEASYESYFRYRDTQPLDISRMTLTNSIGLRHFFSPRLLANGRILRTDATETNRNDLVHHSYSASLTADYLDTLSQTLVFSGNHDTGDGTSYANSVLLRTNADLYEGWSSNLDLGFSFKHPVETGDLTSTTFRLSTDLDPNPKLKFVIDYRLAWNTEKGEPSWVDQNAGFQGFWVPVRTLSFFAAVRLRYRGRDDEGLQVAQDYSVNWAPFPDGLLRLSLGYNQSVDTQNREVRAFSPQIDWQVTRTSLLSVRFNMGTIESDQEKRNVKNVRLILRTYY